MGKYIAKLFISGVIEEKNEDYCQEWLLEQLEKLADDKKNVALMLFISSPGGSVYQSDEMYLAVKKFREETKRPVYAYFSDIAASGGYYIGCSAQKIIANRNTLTGSIGVIANRFLDLTAVLSKHGIKSETIHAGKNKIMGSPDIETTDEHRAIMQSIADECYEQFTSVVAESRNLPIERVKELADGRVYSALQAKANALVDEVMSFDDAVDFLKEKEFGKKDFKAQVRDFKYKPKKTLMTMIRGAFSPLSPLSEAQSLLSRLSPGVRMRYPAYLCEW
ncbi:MAG: signal peptide peptidase SppA [Spirochaetaceae bacterium]|nr:signal peptide peptidase SppA [Spirochaetaceae bacterium]